MVGRVPVVQLFINGTDQAVQIKMKVVGVGKVLQAQPETFNRIEKRAVFGQPDDQQMIFQSRKGCSCGSAGVVGSIIHDQHQPLVGIDGESQVFQESDERFAVLLSGLPGDVARRATPRRIRRNGAAYAGSSAVSNSRRLRATRSEKPAQRMKAATEFTTANAASV